MRFFRWIKVFLQGGRCFKCKYYYKHWYDAGFCTRRAISYRLDSDLCADFKEMERKGK